MILSLLIPTLACRDHYFDRLAQVLEPQLTDDIQVLSIRDDGDEPTGTKRNRLLQMSETPYVAFIDDDDLIAPNYCSAILDAIAESPDVVGFKLRLFEDGVLSGTVVHSFSHRDPKAIRHRTPTHLNPIRREIALSIGFLDQNCGEDVIYADQLSPSLKEKFIDDELYLYYRRNDLRHERHNMNP